MTSKGKHQAGQNLVNRAAARYWLTEKLFSSNCFICFLWFSNIEAWKCISVTAEQSPSRLYINNAMPDTSSAHQFWAEISKAKVP